MRNYFVILAVVRILFKTVSTWPNVQFGHDISTCEGRQMDDVCIDFEFFTSDDHPKSNVVR